MAGEFVLISLQRDIAEYNMKLDPRNPNHIRPNVHMITENVVFVVVLMRLI